MSIFPPTSPSLSYGRLDPTDLAVLIRQLKRSPEAPSRLTLPPIMGILHEDRDEEDENEGDDVSVSVSVEEVDDGTLESASSDYEYEYVDDDRSGLWVIPEESEDTPSERQEEEEEEDSFGDESCPPGKVHSPPIDRYSPPPPRPCITHRPAPIMPELESPILSVPDGLDLFLGPQSEVEVSPSERDGCDSSNSHLASDLAEDPFRYLSDDVPIGSTEVAPTPLTTSRRRRRTLTDLEQYRKWAMNKAAIKTHQEAELAEELRKIREREEKMEKEGLWITCRRSGRYGPRGEGIIRSRSYPPFSVTVPITPTWSSSPSTPYQVESAFQPVERDSFSPDWYDDDEVQVAHVEYASINSNINVSSSTESEPESERLSTSTSPSPTSEELRSPPSPVLETPQEGRRSIFPSASQIFHAPIVVDDNAQGLGLGLGLDPDMGLGLSGMSLDELRTDDEVYPPAKGPDGELEDIEEEGFYLREIPVTYIFPGRNGLDSQRRMFGYGPGTRYDYDYDYEDAKGCRSGAYPSYDHVASDETQHDQTDNLYESPYVRGRPRNRLDTGRARRHDDPTSGVASGSGLDLSTSAESKRMAARSSWQSTHGRRHSVPLVTPNGKGTDATEDVSDPELTYRAEGSNDALAGGVHTKGERSRSKSAPPRPDRLCNVEEYQSHIDSRS